MFNLTGFGISIVLAGTYVICHSFASLKDRSERSEESHARNRPQSYVKARCFAALSMTAQKVSQVEYFILYKKFHSFEG